MNPTRLAFIRSTLCRHFRKDPYYPRPFEGLKFVDIGCGSELLSEPLARMGASVMGIDAADRNINTTRLHAELDPAISRIENCCTSAAIEELNVQNSGNNGMMDNLKSTYLKQIEVFKEPHICSSMRNLFLYSPGCISVDESGYRLFLSDCNHHRVIVFDGNGKILDCIGSSPGFEDGEFESAKLLHPAASFYHDVEDCLYFVDSENNAIRRADLGRRVLETLHPSPNINKKNTSLWSWIISKLGMGGNVETKCEDFNLELLMNPWHLMKSEDGNLLVMNRSFKDLWILNMASGEIKETFTGFSKIWEFCGRMIMEKVSVLKQIPCEWLKEQIDDCSSNHIHYADLMSSSGAFHDHIVICDMVGHRVLKYCRESGVFTNFQFSNFGILGLPYWFALPLEKVYDGSYALSGDCVDHLQSFSLLPGRVDVKLMADIPKDTELVEPIQEGCIWRQARGSATEISGVKGIIASSDKVGVAQQWYDELDHLASSTPDPELTELVNTISQRDSREDRICIDCSVNTSPGTSEVIICAAVYLKLKRSPNLGEETQEKNAERIANILNPKHFGTTEGDACVEFLLKSSRDLGDLIFMKPLRVRLRLDCPDHPKAENSRDIILTDSSVEVHVSLDS